jgi:hypothetical protein
MEWIDTPGELSAVIGIATVVLGGLMWVVRAEVRKVSAEAKPNGGKSLADVLGRIEKDVREIRANQQAHLEYHLEREHQ